MMKFLIVDLATGVASMHGLDGFDARGKFVEGIDFN
jgi:hypothetical protein